MAFKDPITVREAVDRINNRRYVLPAIQREFVWKPDQIERLFDSLLKGYPIGSFLFWTIEASKTGNYDFYHFVQHYHERDHHNPKADVTGAGEVTAVLDGQQRLTSLYIGLRGTYAHRKPRVWKTSAGAYPPRRLYLNLTSRASDPEVEFDFKFREEAADLITDAKGDRWLRAGAILELATPWDGLKYLTDHGLASDAAAQDAMRALHTAVQYDKPISFYLEQAQELDRVLSIFVRVNSGGTVLSYSDLLLSMATASWTELDARETIYRLVDEINRVGRGFAFTKDFVLKTCLMVADFETRFSTTSFTAARMQVIEQRWPEIEHAIRTTVELLHDFGLSADTLPSVNAVVPIVYYIAGRGNPSGFVTASAHAKDRTRIRQWLAIALLKRTFTGQPDSILRLTRDAIRTHGAQEFPAGAIAQMLRGSARPMDVDDSDLDRMLDEEYGSAYAFATLGLLYTSLDLANTFHVDHVHPHVGFQTNRLKQAGIKDRELQEEFQDRRDAVPNLQLLSGPANVSKSGKPFSEWLVNRFGSDAAALAEYRRTHFIPDLSPSLTSFIQFNDARRALMRVRLRDVLGVSQAPDADATRHGPVPSVAPAPTASM